MLGTCRSWSHACSFDARFLCLDLLVKTAITTYSIPSVVSERLGRAPAYGEAVDVPSEVFAEACQSHAVTSPSLWFNVDRIKGNVYRLRSWARRFGISIVAAVKAIPMVDVLGRIAQDVAGFEVSNGREFAMIPRRPHTYMIVNAPGNIVAAPRGGAQETIYVVETVGQAKLLPPHAMALLRLNTSDLLRAGSSKSRMHRRSRFGLTRSEVKPALQQLGSAVRGVHFHLGHERITVEDYLQCIMASRSWFLDAGWEIEILDIGGGFHAVRDSIPKLFQGVHDIGHSPVTIAEPGRELSTGAGFATTRVLSSVRRGCVADCTLDVSAECHLRWSHPYLCTPYPCAGDRTKRIVFYGPTCAESDHIGTFITPSDFECVPGDLLVFGGVNGYSVSWNTEFNGIPAATVCVL